MSGSGTFGKLRDIMLENKKITTPFDPSYQMLLDDYFKFVNGLVENEVNLANEGIHLTGASKIVVAQTEAARISFENIVSEHVAKTNESNGKDALHKASSEDHKIKKNDKNKKKINRVTEQDTLTVGPLEVEISVEFEVQNNLKHGCKTPERPVELIDAPQDQIMEDVDVDALENTTMQIAVVTPYPELEGHECHDLNSQVWDSSSEILLCPDFNLLNIEDRPKDSPILPGIAQRCEPEKSEVGFSNLTNNANRTSSVEAINLKVLNHERKFKNVRKNQMPSRASSRLMLKKRQNLKRRMVLIAEKKSKRRKITPTVQPESESCIVLYECISSPVVLTTVKMEYEAENCTIPINQSIILEEIDNNEMDFNMVILLPENSSYSSLVHTFRELGYASLSAHDEEDCHKHFDQMHSLLFDSELSNSEKVSTFQSLFISINSLFLNYGVELHRTTLTENFAAPISKLRRISTIREDLMAKCREYCNTMLQPSKQDITRKSRQEFNIMRAETQKKIVAKYAKLPLEIEHSWEFFENYYKMKRKMESAILFQLARETFDVQKYCRRIIDEVSRNSARKTFEISESMYGFTIPSCSQGLLSSPTASQSRDSGMWSQPFCSPASQAISENFQETAEILSPGPDIDSIREPQIQNHCSPINTRGPYHELPHFDREWVPMTSVFTKAISTDEYEVARNFSAILHLLSTKELQLNYEQFHSQTSEDITNPSTETGSSDNVNEIGMKYSRCPNLDHEEIYVNLGATNSKDLEGVSLEDANEKNSPPTLCAELDIGQKLAEFVEEIGSGYSGKLGGRSRKDLFNAKGRKFI